MASFNKFQAFVEYLVDGVAGRIKITLAQEDTVAINTNRCVAHECKTQTEDGKVLVLFFGSLTIRDSLIDTLTA